MAKKTQEALLYVLDASGNEIPLRADSNGYLVLSTPISVTPSPISYGYERVEASATDQPLGDTGAAGDILHAVVVDANTGTVVVKDDTTVVLTIPAGFELGKPIILDLTSSAGAWNITTGITTSCVASGVFT